MQRFRISLARGVAQAYESLSLSKTEKKYPFLRREWLTALESSGAATASAGWTPQHLLIESSISGPVAFLPAYVKSHSMGEFVFDHAIADFAEQRLRRAYYPKLVVAVPFTPATGPRVLLGEQNDEALKAEVVEFLTASAPSLLEERGVSSMHVLFPTSDEIALFRSSGWAIRTGVQFQFQNRGFPSFGDFLATFGAKKRAQIRRERRALAERGDVSFEVLTGESLSSVSAELLHRLYLTTVDKYVWGRRYLNASFFARAMETMPDALHVVLARRPGTVGDDGVIAAAFNLLGEEALYGRYWGTFSEVPFLHFETCLYRGIEESIQRRLNRFEPGAGGEHKHGRGFVPTLTQSAHFFLDRRLDAAVRDYFSRESEAIKAELDPPNDGATAIPRKTATRAPR